MTREVRLAMSILAHLVPMSLMMELVLSTSWVSASSVPEIALTIAHSMDPELLALKSKKPSRDANSNSAWHNNRMFFELYSNWETSAASSSSAIPAQVSRGYVSKPRRDDN